MTFVTIVRHVLAALIAAACVILFATLGGSKYLGAHHFWDLKTALIGAPIGAAVFLLSFRLPKQFTLYIFLALGIASFVTAHLGKTEFAASYAENQTAVYLKES